MEINHQKHQKTHKSLFIISFYFRPTLLQRYLWEESLCTLKWYGKLVLLSGIYWYLLKYLPLRNRLNTWGYLLENVSHFRKTFFFMIQANKSFRLRERGKKCLKRSLSGKAKLLLTSGNPKDMSFFPLQFTLHLKLLSTHATRKIELWPHKVSTLCH